MRRRIGKGGAGMSEVKRVKGWGDGCIEPDFGHSVLSKRGVVTGTSSAKPPSGK